MTKTTVFKGLKFVCISAVLALSALAVLSDNYALKSVAAGGSAAVLSGLGKLSQAAYPAPNPLIVFPGFTAEIVDYCSGAVEIAILFGIIFASEDRSVKARLLGFLAGVVLILSFNILRISTTLFFYSPSTPVISAIFHDLLFRASLVVFVATYYAVWYFWGNSADAGKPNRSLTRS